MSRLRKIMAPIASAALISASVIALAAPASAATSQRSIIPNTVKKCDSSTKNWAALYPNFGDWLVGQNAVWCIGNKGTFKIKSNTVQVFCAGNNNGTFWWFDRQTHTYGEANFEHDNSYSVIDDQETYATPDGDPIYVYQVKITGWTGSAGC
jgi:hypothetical protein